MSVKRGVGFAVLAVVVVMAGLSAYPVMALRSGATLTLLMWAVLKLKALQAPRRPYKRTEVWILLEPRPALPPLRAQEIIGGALQECFERHAGYAFKGAVTLWLLSFALRLCGIS